jgi:hypothetical protein
MHTSAFVPSFHVISVFDVSSFAFFFVLDFLLYVSYLLSGFLFPFPFSLSCWTIFLVHVLLLLISCFSIFFLPSLTSSFFFFAISTVPRISYPTSWCSFFGSSTRGSLIAGYSHTCRKRLLVPSTVWDIPLHMRKSQHMRTSIHISRYLATFLNN